MLSIDPRVYINHISPLLTPVLLRPAVAVFILAWFHYLTKSQVEDVGYFTFEISLHEENVLLHTYFSGPGKLQSYSSCHITSPGNFCALETRCFRRIESIPNQVSIYKSSIPSRATQRGNDCWLNLKSVLGGPDFKRVRKAWVPARMPPGIIKWKLISDCSKPEKVYWLI